MAKKTIIFLMMAFLIYGCAQTSVDDPMPEPEEPEYDERRSQVEAVMRGEQAVVETTLVPNEEISHLTRPLIARSSSAPGLTLPEVCGNASYVNESSDYIIEGMVTRSESRYNPERTNIYTYVDMKIIRYLKGTPLLNNEIELVFLGGTVGNITLIGVDPTGFKRGQVYRLHLAEIEDEFSLVCAMSGINLIRDIPEVPRPEPPEDDDTPREIPPPGPELVDLAIENVRMVPESPVIGEPYYLAGTVINKGTRPCHSFTVHIVPISGFGTEQELSLLQRYGFCLHFFSYEFCEAGNPGGPHTFEPGAEFELPDYSVGAERSGSNIPGTYEVTTVVQCVDPPEELNWTDNIAKINVTIVEE